MIIAGALILLISFLVIFLFEGIQYSKFASIVSLIFIFGGLLFFEIGCIQMIYTKISCNGFDGMIAGIIAALFLGKSLGMCKKGE